MPQATVGRYDEFEVQFRVATSASNLDFPFDASPPAGLPAKTGISVDALLSNDNWATTVTQPAFLYQPYTLTTVDGKDHLTPNGAPVWDVRFAPQAAGSWQYRLRAQDADGTSIYPASGGLTFSVTASSSNPYTQHGFLRVSPTDAALLRIRGWLTLHSSGFQRQFQHNGRHRAENAKVRAE